jgi:hypothetical protein
VAIAGKPPGDERLVAEPFSENEIVCITAPDHARRRTADARWFMLRSTVGPSPRASSSFTGFVRGRLGTS